MDASILYGFVVLQKLLYLCRKIERNIVLDDVLTIFDVTEIVYALKVDLKKSGKYQSFSIMYGRIEFTSCGNGNYEKNTKFQIMIGVRNINFTEKIEKLFDI